MCEQKRWILLEHKGAPDDPVGIHFDLLVEDKNVCRTWRLATIPALDGPSQIVIPLQAHRLAWLDHSEGEVSGGRGWAKKVMAGFFFDELPKNLNERFQIELHSKTGLVGNLKIENCLCSLTSVAASRFFP